MQKVLTQYIDQDWALYHGDCCQIIKGIPDNSLHYSIFSPPFASLYTYSSSPLDMGNCRDNVQFNVHFSFLVSELFRCIMPGRLVSMHCMNLPTSKARDGFIGICDFRGDLIRLMQDAGFIYHSEVCIWKDPVTAMQRTKAIGLLHKQIVKDSALSRQGIPDYICTFRKPGENPERIAGELSDFVGENPPTLTGDNTRDSINIWQRYASPIWMDINPSDTLQYRSARDNNDERHICLAKGSLILTYHDGYKKIEDITVGRDLVLTHKGRWMPVIAKKKTSDSAKVLSVNAAGVSNLTVTPTHKLWSRIFYPSKGNFKEQAKNEAPQWNEAKDLQHGYLNLQLPPVENFDDFTDRELWLIGRYVADGHWHVGTEGRSSIYVSVSNAKIDHFLDAVGDMAGTKHNACEGSIQYRIKDPSSKLRNVLENCGKLAHEKQFPSFVFRLSKLQAVHVLNGYLSGDGHLNRDCMRWYATSTSKSLLLGLQMLVLRVHGVTSTLHAGRPERQSKILGRSVNCKQEWVFSFKEKGYSFSFVDDYGAWKKVKSIYDAGSLETWNIQVLDDASYTAEGCVVKNCPLQLSVIRRCLQLWTNPGDVVLDPFSGIGSAGVVALEMGRRYVGFELKESYYNASVNNLLNVSKNQQQSLFEVMRLSA